KPLELVSRINPFAARLGWQRHGPGTVLRLPRDHDRNVARAAEEVREDIKEDEVAPFEDSHLYQQADDCQHWLARVVLWRLPAYRSSRSSASRRPMRRS